MNPLNFLPYKTNILIKPAKKDVVLSDNANAPKYWLYGEIIAIGSEVGTWKFLWWNFKRKDAPKVGDIVGYDKFGIKDIDKDGEKYFFIADDPNFVLGVIPK